MMTGMFVGRAAVAARGLVPALAAALALVVPAACGGDGTAARAAGGTGSASAFVRVAPRAVLPDRLADVVATTAAPSTTSTSATSTSTTSPSTTSPSTTAVAATTTTTLLPQPIPPPLDEHAPEPLIEIGTLAIPAIGVAGPMYEGIRLSTLDHGPGHWPGSAMPGRIGNAVVAGHRTTSPGVFRHIDRLLPGDEVVFEVGTERSVYRVTRTEIVGPDALWIVDQTTEPTATLFACHPPGSTRERIVVFAELAG
jgi:sortase A